MGTIDLVALPYKFPIPLPPAPILVAPLNTVTNACWAIAPLSKLPDTTTYILLLDEVGVIVAAKVVVTRDVDVVDCSVVKFAVTTCNTDPVGNVAFGMVCVPVS